MTPQEFLNKYRATAKEAQTREGIHYIALLAQSACETGWGNTVVGNMMFGVKDTDGINGNEQLLTTTEYLSTNTAKFPAILKITQVAANRWKYIVKDYFRKYDSPADSFADHARFLKANKRYAKAMLVANDPVAFVQELASSGYATAPNYGQVLSSVVIKIQHLEGV